MSMLSYCGRRFALTAAIVLGMSACQERLAAPADCPALCPGGVQLRDTVLTPISDGDTSFSGYRTAGQGTSLRVSYQFAASEDRAIYRFTPRGDSVLVDSMVPFASLDSILFEFSLLKRDSSVTGLTIFLYRLPPTVDSTTTFAEVEAAFVPSAIVDSFVVADSVTTQRFSKFYSGAALVPWIISAADSGVLALGVQIRAASGTGIRIGGIAAGSAGPSFVNYVTAPSSDTTNVTRTLSQRIAFNTFVSQTTPINDIDELTVGGVPSSRAILRFPWPNFLRDSAQIVRATLELTPLAPFPGLATDTAFLQVRPVLADFGSKSPGATDAFFIGVGILLPGASDTVRIEVRRATTLWQGANPLPSVVLLQLFPEISSFTRAVFGSTRSPGAQARLRITYALPFPFEAP
ncbi:MAG: hypothetical protein ABI587_09310 [Gemmatimonadales bacterium]